MDGQFPIKIALPKGRLLEETSSLLEAAGWGLEGYHQAMRFYRLRSRRFPNLLAKVFHEKDIPIQVAVGNYDLGICGLDWVEELLVKYPSSALVKLRNLGYGKGSLYIAGSRSGRTQTTEGVLLKGELIRIASEYPNLAESFALKRRLKKFAIFPLWGAAEAYPPENAELTLLSATKAEDARRLVTISRVLGFSAFLIANRDSWREKDLSPILPSIDRRLAAGEAPVPAEDDETPLEITTTNRPPGKVEAGIVRLALPDGHQQKPTTSLLEKSCLQINDYPSAKGNRRPTTSLSGVRLKVIRPQDMPLQVANGNFDMAITGRDWLREHLAQFPSSPVTELLDLKFGKVKIVAVISDESPADNIDEFRQYYTGLALPVRVASEYINIADKYARENHLGMYKIIPTWGASEAFLPEDADLLIENTETGSTIARHNLKIMATLFESTACLIGNKDSIVNPTKSKKLEFITETLRQAVAES